MLSIISFILHGVCIAVLNMQIYTDTARLPDGGTRQWHRSPIDRLNLAGTGWLLYLYLALAAVSALTGILVLCGAQSGTVRKVQIAANAATVLLFILIMILTSNANARYA